MVDLKNDINDFDIMSGDKLVAMYKDKSLEIIDTSRCPLFLLNTGDFVSWMRLRAIDGSRHNSRSLKRAFNLSSFEVDFNTSKQMNGATITDNFWIRKCNSELTYEDITFKKNDFFKAALDIDKSLYEKKPSRTPELTNIGSQEKGWNLECGKWWLYKNERRSEIEAEYITYRIGELLGYNMAKYEIVGDCEYIKTEDFTKGKYNLQHANSIVGTCEDFNYNFEKFNEIMPALNKEYIDIIILDILCGNVDRHTENYGILTDRQTGEFVGFTPNYDNNETFGTYRNIKNTDLTNGREIKALRELVEKQKIVINLPRLDKAKAVEIIASAVRYSDDSVEDISAFLFDRYDFLSKETYVRV